MSARLAAGLKRFQPILDGARARDVTEADTVTIVQDVLAEVLGCDKYAQVRGGHVRTCDKEGWLKSHLEDFAAQQEALSKYSIGALVCSEAVLNVLRRELRRLSPDTRIDVEQIEAVLRTDVLKREIIEGEKADSAKRTLARVARKAQRAKAQDAPADATTATLAAQAAS